MISIRGLGLESGDVLLDPLSLEIADGEIYFLLDRLGFDLLFHVLNGLRPADDGDVLFSGGPAGNGKRDGAVFIDRVAEVADFETEAPMADWIDFLCSACGYDRESIFKTLLVCNFHERYLKKKLATCRRKSSSRRTWRFAWPATAATLSSTTLSAAPKRASK